MAHAEAQLLSSAPLSFSVALTEMDDRLDCLWFEPAIDEKITSLRDSEPAGGKLVALGSVANIRGGKRLPAGAIVDEEFFDIPYIGAKDVKELNINHASATKISKETHRLIQNFQLKKNDIAITVAGTVGNVGILADDLDICDYSENIARIRCSDVSISPRYILHFLESDLGRAQIDRLTVGSVQYKLSLANCRNIMVYIPHDGHSFDIDRQNTVLDQTYKLLEQAKAKSKERAALLEQANSVVVDTLQIKIPAERKDQPFSFEAGSSTAERLDVKFNSPFREKLVERLRKNSYKLLSELTKPQSIKSIPSSDYYSLIDLEQIDGATGQIGVPKEVATLGSKKIMLNAGSILVAKLQPESKKTVIVPDEYDGIVGSSELVPLTLDSDDVTPKYLWAILRSDYTTKQWEYSLTGSSRMRVDNTSLEQTIIPMPDGETQNSITESIDTLMSKAEELSQVTEDLKEKASRHFLSSITEQRT